VQREHEAGEDAKESEVGGADHPIIFLMSCKRSSAGLSANQVRIL
jgi:hypothetical protein